MPNCASPGTAVTMIPQLEAVPPMEVVTVDNFHEKLSKWDEAHKQLFAIVDMGSNGIRFSISDLSEPQSRLLPCVYSERAAISLYDALHDNEDPGDPEQLLFSEKVIKKVAKTLARFKNICDQYEVPPHQIDVFATAAMRSASNRHEMLAEIKKQSGLDVKILEPATESLFGAMGARSGFHSVDGLFMDLGGGSCQMTYVDCQQKDYENLAAGAGRSIPFGAARLTAELKKAKTQSELVKVDADLKTAMQGMFEGLKASSPHIKEKLEHSGGINVYMCGGGFRGYGSMLMYKHEIQPYPIPTISGFTVSGQHFIRSSEMLEANKTEEKIFGLSKRRREQFPAITKVIEAIIAVVPHIQTVTFCTGSNREGALFMKLSPETRETDPLIFYPIGLSGPNKGILSTSPASSEAISSAQFLLDSALIEPFHKYSVFHYISHNIWTDMGSSDEVNSSKALNITITGILDNLPGVSHRLRAIIALILCARWGTVLGPANRRLYGDLQLVLGKDLSFWCQYLGTVARFLAPFAFLGRPLGENVSINTSLNNDLGKKGKKSGIKIQFGLTAAAMQHIDVSEALGMFKHVGKGLGMKVEASAVLDDEEGDDE